MAKSVIINSAALPRVALSSPPRRGPVCSAISSVAWPRIPAAGMTASAEAMNRSVGDQPRKLPTIATSANTRRMFKYFIERHLYLPSGAIRLWVSWRGAAFARGAIASRSPGSRVATGYLAAVPGQVLDHLADLGD